MEEEKLHVSSRESSRVICLQVLPSHLLAGLGMVTAGMLLDQAQRWEVFKEIPEVFILVPALMGLKGNLEKTLASRPSTATCGTCVQWCVSSGCSSSQPGSSWPAALHPSESS
ncbi:solute carrier family 41 member 2-like [Limanda limanda]|uniref:solute carrier family 41 member 2-like n=1 Tax=Limanda limanda TaxID=27771 RepID=UPI0029C8DE4A|nr:solute carrier family 41 member 2-like [Limanda limanda]